MYKKEGIPLPINNFIRSLISKHHPHVFARQLTSDKQSNIIYNNYNSDEDEVEKHGY